MFPSSVPQSRRKTLWLAVALVGALMVVPAAGASPILGMQVHAQEAKLDGASSSTSGAHLVSLAHPADATADRQRITIHIVAASAQITQYHEEQYEGNVANQAQQAPSAETATNDPSEPIATTTLTGVTFDVEAAEGDYYVNGFADLPLKVEGSSPAIDMTPMRSASMDRSGIYAGAPNVGQQDEGAQRWTHRHVDEAQVLSNGQADNSTIVVTGDAVLELLGIDFSAIDATGSTTHYHTGVTRDPVAASPVSSDGMFLRKTDFARLTLTSATVAIQIQSPGGRIQWSADSTAASASHATLLAAEGSFDGPDGPHSISGTDLDVDGPLQLNAEAQDPQTLAIHGKAQPAGYAPSAHARIQLASSPFVLLAGALVAALALAAIIVHKRRGHTPSQGELEEALADGEYARAATLASRILQARPGAEDAVIGRAIALAKQGQPERVIAELTAHLGTKDPTDGVVHYVLGLAYLDLGHADKARAALEEAVRRTPSLMAEASARLGAPPMPHPMLSPPSPALELEAHGYA